jgi:hypothetical protein
MTASRRIPKSFPKAMHISRCSFSLFFSTLIVLKKGLNSPVPSLKTSTRRIAGHWTKLVQKSCSTILDSMSSWEISLLSGRISREATDIRLLLAVLRTATLRHDTDTQGTILTLLLRNFIRYKLYDQADKLVSRTTFPESSGNNLYARYVYYLGRIRAIQLDYSDAHKNLLMAIRKAPQNKAAAGFIQQVRRFFVAVELLMGDLPDRSTFRQPMFEKVLAPYAQIVQGIFPCSTLT